MKFLKFTDESAAQAAFNPWIIEDQFPSYIDSVTVDVLGTILKPIGEPDEEGNQEFEALEGFHVNLSSRVPELADFEIEAPDAPYRVFAGYDGNSTLVYKQFTPLEYLDLFTEQEQLNVAEATMSSAAVKLWYDRLLAASFVTAKDSRTEDGLLQLCQAGLLSETRVQEILNEMITED